MITASALSRRRSRRRRRGGVGSRDSGGAVPAGGRRRARWRATGGGHPCRGGTCSRRCCRRRTRPQGRPGLGRPRGRRGPPGSDRPPRRGGPRREGAQCRPGSPPPGTREGSPPPLEVRRSASSVRWSTAHPSLDIAPAVPRCRPEGRTGVAPSRQLWTRRVAAAASLHADPPAATVRIRSGRSSGWSSLSRKPATPRARASSAHPRATPPDITSDADRRVRDEQFPRRLQARHPRHLNVHQHDVRCGTNGRCRHLAAVGAGSDDVDVVGRGEHSARAKRMNAWSSTMRTLITIGLLASAPVRRFRFSCC